MNVRLPNYKILASIYNIFQAETTTDTFNPEDVVNSKFTVLENIVGKKKSVKNDNFLKEYKEKDKDLRLLAYQILVDKFNTKYKSLNESQKDLGFSSKCGKCRPSIESLVKKIQTKK